MTLQFIVQAHFGSGPWVQWTIKRGSKGADLYAGSRALLGDVCLYRNGGLVRNAAAVLARPWKKPRKRQQP